MNIFETKKALNHTMRNINIPSLFTLSDDSTDPSDREHRLSSANRLLGKKTTPLLLGGKGCPLRAPSVYYLETELKMQIKKARLDPSKHKVYEIEENVIRKLGKDLICPRDGRKGCAYVDAIDDDAHNAGKATHMLSYTWGYVSGKIISSLVEYTKQQGLDPKQTFVWICCLCVNQHRVKEAEKKKEVIEFEEFANIFHQRIVDIGHVLSLMMPWDDPIYTKRVWCIYELHSAIALGAKTFNSKEDKFGRNENRCKFDIIMPPEEATDFARSISSGNTQKLWDALKNIKIENADASVEQDKINIFQAVEAGPGFSNLNKVVREKLQTWVLESGENIARQDLYSDQKIEEAAMGCGHVAQLSIFMGDLPRAKALLSDALHVLEQNGAGETATAAFLTRKLGVVKRFGGDLRGALESYNRTIELHGLLDDTSSEDCANVYMNKGNMHSELNEFKEACESYNESRNIRLRINKLETDKGALLLTNTGAVQGKMKKYKEAMETFHEATRIRLVTKTSDSPDGAFLLDNIALVEGEMGEFDVAMNKYIQARKLRDTLGTHRSMDGALHSAGLGQLHLNMKDFKKALEYFEEAMNIHKELGTLDKSEGVEVVEAMIQCQTIVEHLDDTSSPSFCVDFCN